MAFSFEKDKESNARRWNGTLKRMSGFAVNKIHHPRTRDKCHGIRDNTGTSDSMLIEYTIFIFNYIYNVVLRTFLEGMIIILRMSQNLKCFVVVVILDDGASIRDRGHLN